MKILFKILRKILFILLTLVFIFACVLTGLGFIEYKKAVNEKSIVNAVEEIRSQENFIPLKDMSKYMPQAMVAIEDHRFYDHGGVDYISLTRAICKNILNKKMVEGGSTITQQLAKNMYFGFEPSLVRKVGEVFVSKELEKYYTKDEILELYLNIVNFGDNHFGIYEAAYGYYRKHPKDLNLVESSTIAGITQSPSNYQLSNHNPKTKQRQIAVIEAMVKYMELDDESAEFAKAADIFNPSY